SRNILMGRSVDRTGRRFRRCSAPVHHRHRPRRKVVGGTAKVRIEALQAELAKLEAVAGGPPAAFERERDRADRLLGERWGRRPTSWRPGKRRGGSKAGLRPCE